MGDEKSGVSFEPKKEDGLVLRYRVGGRIRSLIY